ncbi:hypothetical protein [Sphingomonas sp.]|uniref:hypothetical protein n=1 Tax=Sphingomonas sp. TaxID=28214 RepID=UPI0035C81027
MTPKVEARMRRAVADLAARVAARLAEVPGVRVTAGEDAVVVEGRNLARRVVEEPALRWPGAGT